MTASTRRTFTEALFSSLGLGLPISVLTANVQAQQQDGAQASITITYVDNLAGLKALATRPAIVAAAGFRVAGDGGGGIYLWSSGAGGSGDGISTIAPTRGPPGHYILHPGAPISVAWTGASGLGDADATMAFRAALSVARVIFVPPGIYTITETLFLNGATIFGSGPQSILSCEHPDFHLFEVSGIGSRIKDLSIWGAATDHNTTQFGIVTSSTSPPQDLAITNVRFSGATKKIGLNNGIKFGDGAKNCRVQNSHFEQLIGQASGTGYGVLTGAVDGLVVTGNNFEGSRTEHQGRHAVYASAGGRRIVVSNNIVREFNSEALCTNAYHYQPAVEQIVFAHNLVSGCGADGVNQSSISAVGKARTVRIEGNVIVDSAGCGILCDAGSVLQENITVDGNSVIDSAYFGIRQLGALQQAIRNNYVRGSSRRSPGTWADIVVGGAGIAAPEQILVVGNQCVPIPGISSRAFVLNRTTPLPKTCSLAGNDFPAEGYAAGPDYASDVVTVWIDGQLQFEADWSPPLVDDKSSAARIFIVPGAAPGDVVVCSHPSIQGGYLLAGTVNRRGEVIVTLANLSGSTKMLAQGRLRLAVWKPTRSGA